MLMLLSRPIKSPPVPIAPLLRAEEGASRKLMAERDAAAAGVMAAAGVPRQLRETVSLPQLAAPNGIS